MIELRVLGSTELTRDGVSVQSVLVQPKRLALLVYLLLAYPGGFTRRDHLLSVFWPESDDTHARNALRQALHKLRKSLGADLIAVRGDDEVGVVEGGIRVDALELDRAARDADAEALLRLSRGRLLEGFHLASAPAFGEWLDRERHRRARVAGEALVRCAEEREARGELESGLTLARAAADLRPADEAAARAVVRILARTGDRAGALARYERLERDLDAELQTTVAPETFALAQRLREQDPGSGPAGRDPPGPLGRSGHGATPRGASGEGNGTPSALVLQPLVPVAGMLLVLAAGVAVALAVFPEPVPELPPGAEIVLADAPGLEPDDQLRALEIWLRLELQASEAISVVPRGRVEETLRRMDRNPAGDLTLPLALEMSRRNGHAAVILPSFSRLGNEWLLGLEVHLPDGSAPLLVGPESASGTEELDEAVEGLARRLRERLGEARDAIQETAPLPEVTTGSFDALRAYALGERELQRSIWSTAIDHFGRAVELDSAFASAWARLGEVRLVNGQGPEAVEAFRRAYVLRDRLPAVERPVVEFLYHFFAERDAHAAGVVSDGLAGSYPARRAPWLRQQMLLAAARLDWAGGAGHARALLESDTDLDAFDWWLVVAHLLSAGDVEGALAALDRWEREDGATSDVTGARFRVACELGDWDEAVRLIGTDFGRELAGTYHVYWQSHLALVRGRLQASERAFQEWLAVPGVTDSLSWIRLLAWRALVDLHVLGDTAAARTRLEPGRAAMDRLPTLVRPTLAIAYAHLGDPGTARRILAPVDPDLHDLEARGVRREFRSAESAILLAEGRTEEAIRVARAALEEDSGGRADCEACPALALARALEDAGRGVEAIPLYESVRDANWILSSSRQMDAAFLIPVRARLAVLYAAAGREAEAREENVRILQDWGGGDGAAQRWVRAAQRRLAILERGGDG